MNRLFANYNKIINLVHSLYIYFYNIKCYYDNELYLENRNTELDKMIKFCCEQLHKPFYFNPSKHIYIGTINLIL